MPSFVAWHSIMRVRLTFRFICIRIASHFDNFLIFIVEAKIANKEAVMGGEFRNGCIAAFDAL